MRHYRIVPRRRARPSILAAVTNTLSPDLGRSASAAGTLGTPPALVRLTALWALVESALGGLMHAFHIPLAGIWMGSVAAVLILLIAYFAARPRDILQATLLVLIVKAVGSPHTSLGGYTAVAFQGLWGFAVFGFLGRSLPACLLYSTVALLESAVQRLLMLALLYGRPLAEAIDEWGEFVRRWAFPERFAEALSLSGLLIGVYLTAYTVAGLLLGYFLYRLPVLLERERVAMAEETPARLAPKQQASAVAKTPRAAWRRYLPLVALAVLVAVLSYADSSSPLVSGGMYLARTALILAVWYGVLGPLLARFVRQYLLRKQGERAGELREVMDWLPQLRGLASGQYAQLATRYSGLELYRRWLLRTLVVALGAASLSPQRT